MSASLMFYALKLHSAARYKDLAFEVKSFSAALSGRLDLWGRQDEWAATALMNDKNGANGSDIFEHVVPLPMALDDDDPDREPKDTAFQVISLAYDHEFSLEELAKKHDRPGFRWIAASRRCELERIRGYIVDGSIFGQHGGSHGRPTWWECSRCGQLHRTGADEYGKDA